MCGCPVSGYQASYRESETKVNTFSPQATPVRLRVRAAGRTPPDDRVDADRTPLESGVVASSTNGQVEKRGGVPRADHREPALRAATTPGPRIIY